MDCLLLKRVHYAPVNSDEYKFYFYFENDGFNMYKREKKKVNNKTADRPRGKSWLVQAPPVSILRGGVEIGLRVARGRIARWAEIRTSKGSRNPKNDWV